MNAFFGGIGGGAYAFQQAYQAGKTERRRRQQAAFDEMTRQYEASRKKEPQTQAEWIAEMRRLEFENKLANAKEAEWSSIPHSTRS